MQERGAMPRTEARLLRTHVGALNAPFGLPTTADASEDIHLGWSTLDAFKQRRRQQLEDEAGAQGCEPNAHTPPRLDTSPVPRQESGKVVWKKSKKRQLPKERRHQQEFSVLGLGRGYDAQLRCCHRGRKDLGAKVRPC